MAGIIKVDRVQSDSNLAFNIAGANVAFMDASALRLVGSGITANGTTIVSGGRVATSSMPVGTVLQVVSANKVDAFTTSSATAVDVTGLSVTITPTAVTSKFLLISDLVMSHHVSYAAYWNFVRNSTSLSIGTAGSSFNSTGGIFNYSDGSIGWSGTSGNYLDSPSTTSPITYKIQMFSGGSGYTVGINRRMYDTNVGGSSNFTVMEIAG